MKFDNEKYFVLSPENSNIHIDDKKSSHIFDDEKTFN